MKLVPGCVRTEGIQRSLPLDLVVIEREDPGGSRTDPPAPGRDKRHVPGQDRPTDPTLDIEGAVQLFCTSQQLTNPNPPRWCRSRPCHDHCRSPAAGRPSSARSMTDALLGSACRAMLVTASRKVTKRCSAISLEMALSTGPSNTLRTSKPKVPASFLKSETMLARRPSSVPFNPSS